MLEFPNFKITSRNLTLILFACAGCRHCGGGSGLYIDKGVQLMKLLHPYILSQSNNYFGKCRIKKKNYSKERETTIRLKGKVIRKYLFKINRNNVPVPWPYRDVGWSVLLGKLFRLYGELDWGHSAENVIHLF